MVETILVEDGETLARPILPDLHMVLRRSESFLEQYASLQLSEEADLIVAKLTGNRTAEEILERTPHDREEVFRLLAALVAVGLLEPVPVAVPDEDLAQDILVKAPETEEPPKRRLRVLWLVIGALVVIGLLIGGAILLSRAKASATVEDPQDWGVVVDDGCEPQDLQRILNKAGRFPDAVRAQRADSADGAPCWQLIWGRFTTRDGAEKAMAKIPRSLQRGTFTPRVIPLEGSPQPEGDSKGDGRGPG